MSIQTVCDGCGKPAETQERGLIKKLDYCEKCVQSVDKYLAARDDLHTDLVDQWQESLIALKAKYKVVLPDE